MAPIRMCVLALLLASLGIVAGELAGQQPDDQRIAFNQGISKEPTVEVLDRGIVHEAFAHPAEQKVAPPPAIDRPPPDPVPELPAEQKPSGDNVQWLPGYWAWDGERKEFTWISGLYRDVPAGRQYVPGYWARTEDGWQWVPGYFAPEQQAEAPQYVPEPPAMLDAGPSVPAPDDNSFYTPGWWSYNDGEYFWRPGFWAPYRPGFVWVCPRYLWSPRGWIFCNGYWDYPFGRRGLLFAPLALRGGWGPGWAYRPRFAVGGLLNGLFWRAGSPYYRFGPYFGANFARAGYRPWFNGPNRFDPLVSYYRWQNRGNAGWFDGLQRSYQNVVRGPGGPQVALVNQLRNTNVRVANQSPEQLVQQRVNAQAYRQAAVQRSKVEMRRDVTPRVSTPAKTGAAPARSAPPLKGTRPPPAVNRSAPPPASRPAAAPAPKATSPPPPSARTASPQPVTPRPAAPRQAAPRPPAPRPAPSYLPRVQSRPPAYSSRAPTSAYSAPRYNSPRYSAPRSSSSYRPSAPSYRSAPSASRSGGGGRRR